MAKDEQLLKLFIVGVCDTFYLYYYYYFGPSVVLEGTYYLMSVY